MSTRKFYKTIIPIEILSEEPINPNEDITSVIEQSVSGDYSMRVLEYQETILDGKQTVEALWAQASDPMFFNLTKEGEDSET